MSKVKTQFICQNCNAFYSRWTGVCTSCNSWNSIVEEVVNTSSSMPFEIDYDDQIKLDKKEKNIVSIFDNNDLELIKRKSSGISEVDRVLGGGIVSSSIVLIGGDPGVGKSTLLLQVADSCCKNYKCLYISGEESLEQIAMRAKRLNLKHDIKISINTDLESIIKSAKKFFMINKNADKKEKLHKGILVIDSIQTMYYSHVPSSPGSINQVRACSNLLINFGKSFGVTVIIVGHVTKDGSIAGPRVLEHMVDTVIYFEGERDNSYRILRSVKNRFGSNSEIGVFDMTQEGLKEVKNPSQYFINNDIKHSGTTIFPSIEGSRTILTEVQSLVSKTNFAVPRRSVIGWDSNRLAMILAVLETKCNIILNNKDIYLNVVGGFRLQETGADLAVAAAIISAQMDIPWNNGTLFFGEIGLSGEIRGIAQLENRIKEGSSLGFSDVICPKSKYGKNFENNNSIKINMISHISEISDILKNQ